MKPLREVVTSLLKATHTDDDQEYTTYSTGEIIIQILISDYASIDRITISNLCPHTQVRKTITKEVHHDSHVQSPTKDKDRVVHTQYWQPEASVILNLFQHYFGQQIYDIHFKDWWQGEEKGSLLKCLLAKARQLGLHQHYLVCSEPGGMTLRMGGGVYLVRAILMCIANV